MAAALPSMVVDEITDFLATSPQPEQIIRFRLSESIERRAVDLLERNRQNELTADEQIEMDDFIRMDHFMTILKAKTRLVGHLM
jgi:hypothetical protein